MYGYTCRPSAAQKKEFHEKMLEIEAFCKKHGISASHNNDSYYFSIKGQRYRVSNHSIEASNRAAFDEYTGEQLRELYHDPELEEDVIDILAGKTRIIDIYNDLVAGYDLDYRGRRVE